MTAFEYSRPLATANRLIERFGQLGAIEKPGEPLGPTYDPGEPVPITTPARFVIIGFEAKEIDGTRVLATDKKALVAPGVLTADPTPADRLVEANGVSWSIVAVDTLRPAETTLLHTLQVRR
ncbi:hypothetical protein [Brevundimonas sp. NIBR11]|uniref:hypothetical protein n=1 Tax=Brevundimonas sp. NIBR11 TaxID=3015999 RepID=UPI0022F100A7|nr:hypothetical protein [Brevundimonas sp. NIBR11]WGM31494.1 hypothetical protein KKHFBJBL_01741 [Brevundimonas sp. NIBR11]